MAQLSLDDVPTPVDGRAAWRTDARRWLEGWLVEHPVLFAEDIQAELAAAVGAPGKTSWLGPVITGLARDGWIAGDGFRVGSNGSPKPVWRSLKYRGGAA